MMLQRYIFYRTTATAEEQQKIPWLSQSAHLRDAVYPATPVTALAEFQKIGRFFCQARDNMVSSFKSHKLKV